MIFVPYGLVLVRMFTLTDVYFIVLTDVLVYYPYGCLPLRTF